MRFREFKSVISEGGNVFKSKEGPLTQRIMKADVPTTTKWLEKVTGLPLSIQNWLGTTGRKESSGDLDLVVDANQTEKEDLIAKLTQWCAKNKVDPREYIRKSGISVHFRCPINGNAKSGFVQVDFMFTDTPDWMRWSMSADTPSAYKDADRQILLASIAKAMGLRWIAQTGLVTRDTNKLVANTPDRVVDILFGPNAKPADMKSVENILKKLKTDPERETKLADARGSLPHIKFDE